MVETFEKDNQKLFSSLIRRDPVFGFVVLLSLIARECSTSLAN
jgi:hypothetical protein